MEEFNPPISERGDDELIIISHSSGNDWQQSAIDQAKAELERRGVLSYDQKYRYAEIKREEEKAWQQELDRRKVEDYSILEKVLMTIFWMKYLLRDWRLKEEGFELKAKRRRQLFLGGISMWAIFFCWMNYDFEIQEQKRLKEIENAPISQWEKDRIACDSIANQQKLSADSISKIKSGNYNVESQGSFPR